VLVAASVTFSSGFEKEIDEAELADYGITLLTAGTLHVFSEDLSLGGNTFHLQISTTVVEEMTWFDRTLFTIRYQKTSNIVTPNGAYFLEELANQAVEGGVASSWKLPEYHEGSLSVKEIRIDSDPRIASQISFIANSRTVLFSGQGFIKNKLIVEIRVSLVNELGEFPYTQVVIVYPSYAASTEEEISSIEDGKTISEEELVV